MDKFYSICMYLETNCDQLRQYLFKEKNRNLATAFNVKVTNKRFNPTFWNIF